MRSHCCLKDGERAGGEFVLFKLSDFEFSDREVSIFQGWIRDYGRTLVRCVALPVIL